MIRSSAYGRAKLVNGLLIGLLGAVIAYRTFAVAGLRLNALPGVVLGLAMVGLAAFRLRAYALARRT